MERDSVAIWWYNRLKRPGIDLASCGDTDHARIHDYDTIGRDVWALDLTTDLGITSVVALSRDRDGDAERILMGLGCHLDPRIAVQRALAEMNQMLGVPTPISSVLQTLSMTGRRSNGSRRPPC